MIPPHTRVEDEHGNIIYKRLEAGGNTREMRAWPLQNCLSKLRDKQKDGKLNEFFAELTKVLEHYNDGPDPMMKEWYAECVNNCNTAYYMLTEPVAPPATIETFGMADEIEEFGYAED